MENHHLQWENYETYHVYGENLWNITIFNGRTGILMEIFYGFTMGLLWFLFGKIDWETMETTASDWETIAFGMIMG